VKINYYFVAGIAYIAVYTGYGIAKIGTLMISTTETYPWSTPLMLSVALAIPFLLGFFAGQDCIHKD
jgi:cytochrome c biogenesis protein CcdA